MNNKPLVIDSFPYAGEKVQLEIRFHELNPVVDRFLIVESNRTQTGLPKPYYFEEQQKDFEQFKDKIVYVKLDDSILNEVAEADWIQEFRVRRAISTIGFQRVEESGELIFADSVIIISDVDEIPRKIDVEKFIKSNQKILCLNHYFGSYFLNLHSTFREWGWYGSILVRAGELTDIQYLRNIKDRLPHTGDEGEGWHFSNLLVDGFETMYKKWQNNIEPHNKECLSNKDLLKERFDKCVLQEQHFFFCDAPDKRQIKMEKLPLDLLPECVKSNQEKYKNLIIE